MSGKIFIDTNVLIYSVADDIVKRDTAERLLLNSDIVVSSQVINEFIAVTLRKKILETVKIVDYAQKFIDLFEFVLIKSSTITSALTIMQKYRLGYWDSLIIAAALENDCRIIHSEDLQHGQQIEDKLTIINPFSLE